MTDATTITKLVDLYHSSRSAGESVHLFMESKNGKDSITFSINPSGPPAGKAETWTPCSALPPPWSGRKSYPPPGTPMLIRRKKTPSQLRRDQRRRVNVLAKKAAASAHNDVKEESSSNKDDREKIHLVEPTDEITLTEFTNDNHEATENDLIKIVGQYKNPMFKPWSVVKPEEEIKTLWKRIEAANHSLGIKEIGEGSTCFEHCFEFWGTWKIQNAEKINIAVLKNAENWPNGTKILDVELKPGWPRKDTVDFSYKLN